jgi:hypothetical protein
MELNPSIQRKEIDGGANAAYWNTVRRGGHTNPEQDLMLAVLKDALLNYRKNLRTPNKSLKADQLWFFTDAADRLFSFESVCAVLGLDAGQIRKHLLAWETENQSESPARTENSGRRLRPAPGCGVLMPAQPELNKRSLPAVPSQVNL